MRALAARPRGRRLLSGLISLLALGGLTAVPAIATNPPRLPRPVLKMIWGPVTLPNGKSAFAVYHRLGVDVFEVDLNWADTAPTKPRDARNPSDPAYAWPSELAYAVQQAAHYRMHLCFLVQDSPRWANGGRVPAWAPNRSSDYANFLFAASHHYPSVHDWMIWGEPNRDGAVDFRPMPKNSPVGPRRYALLLNAAYHGLKRASAKNIVIGGDTWSFGVVQPADFIRWMRLPNGKPPPLDYYGHNPFGVRFPRLAKPYYPGGRDIDDIGTLETQLKHTYHRRVPLWLSEFTVSSDHGNAAFAFSVSRKEQAKWVTAAFRLVNSVHYVAGLGWFTLLDDPTSIKRGLTNGLMTYKLQRKPAFYAYKRAR